MVNSNLHKVIVEHFSLAFTVFEIVTSENSLLGNLDQGHDEQHSQWRYCKCMTFCLMAILMFVFLASTCKNNHLKSLTVKI